MGRQGKLLLLLLTPAAAPAVGCCRHCCLWMLLQATSLAPLEGLRLCDEYLEWCEKHPTHMRMVRGHVHKLITVGEVHDSSDVMLA